jgi:hypothetical protein
MKLEIYLFGERVKNWYGYLERPLHGNL